MRTKKQIEANYTELIHAGEGISIERGKISASGGSGGGSQPLIVTADWSVSDSSIVIDIEPIEVYNAVKSGRLVMIKDVEAFGDDAVCNAAVFVRGNEGGFILSTLQALYESNELSLTCFTYALTANSRVITRDYGTVSIS